MLTVLSTKPWSPFVHRQTDTSVEEFLAVGSKVEDIGHEHRRYALLVFHDVVGTICPCDTRSKRCFDLANDHRDTVDDKHEVQAFAAMSSGTRVNPLVGHYAVVAAHVLLIKEADIDILAILAEGERVLVEEETTEGVVVLYDSLLGGRLDIAAHLVDDLVGLLSRDIVERNERFAQP